ncbi:MAG: NAD(P)/FAD-dependent oxidoreductase [Leptolyngbyaceae cyanobacterium MO_188.B28]|nr:NAD(P)/FAD-dependent oxidoreductase [Leptolyngbyaceae cyanobacterium MO_188.B28]
MAHTPLYRQLIRTLQIARRENLKADGKSPPFTRTAAGWTRRRFIKSAALAGGGALAAKTLSRATPVLGDDNYDEQPRIAVVGGGIAGLNAAYQLKKAGLKATVYEARPRLGGRILSVAGAIGEGLVTDLGGSFINTDHDDMLALVEEFDLELFNRVEDAARFPLSPTGYYFDGRRIPEEEVATLLRPLAQQIAADAALLDQDYDKFAPIFDRISATQYLDTHADKIPQPFIRTLMESTIRTEYGGEPDESAALQFLFILPTVNGQAVDLLSYSDETFVVKGGGSQIIARLAAQLPGQIQTRMRLSKIQSRGTGFRLTFDGDRIVDADYVIMAIPFTVLRHVEIEVQLPGALKRFIHEVDLGSNEKLFAGFHQKAWRQEAGFVKDANSDLGFSSAWDATQRQVDREDGSLMFFLGGNETEVVRRDNPKQVGRQFVNQLNRFTPGLSAASTGKFMGTQWTQDPLTYGGYTNFKVGQLTEFADFVYIESDNPAERQDVQVGNLFFAGEHVSEDYGFMNSGAQTGRLAAAGIVRLISRNPEAGERETH